METNQNNSPLAVPAAIVMAGFVVAAAVVYSNGGGLKLGAAKADSDKPAAQTARAVNNDEALAVQSDDRVLGNPSAPVTIIEYADFQCPFCGRFESTTVGQLKEKYVKTGQAKIIYRDFAFLGPESVESAEAARCANEQGKFWDFHDYLYAHQNGENQGAFAAMNLKKFAGALKLDQAKFDSCLDDHKYKSAVEASLKTGQALGVTGTPTTFVNGQEIVGAQPIAQFEALIKAALAK
ncbi:MAG: DsbA family protein [Candidatus Niyogibacteria bacterium]|nr:DsbA family protein [Candidatus Niyogibacteria bacterium]